jgi:hypothetical protein
MLGTKNVLLGKATLGKLSIFCVLKNMQRGVQKNLYNGTFLPNRASYEEW